MNDLSDQQLLRDYAKLGSDPAFAELVHRHINLVYSAALRMVRDPQLAEDIAQSVFIALAKNAGQLGGRAVLSGWLHKTARNLAANTVRSDSRRRTREQEAARMKEILSSDSNVSWEHIARELDLELSELSEADRDAVLLRYFEEKSAQEMASILGISEEAAQRRVNRAVERLRDSFARKGISIGVAGLAAVISTNAVQSAPVGLSASIAAASLTAGAAMPAPAVAVGKVLVMTALKKALAGAAAVAIAGGAIYEMHRVRSETSATKPPAISAIAPAAPNQPVALADAQVQAPAPSAGTAEPPAISAIAQAPPSRPVVAPALAQVLIPPLSAGARVAHEPSLAKAEEVLSNTVALAGPHPESNTDVLIQQGQILARTGKWKEAADNFAGALQLDPSDAWAGYYLSSALLQSGNLGYYQKNSHAMMVRFGDSENGKIAGLTGEAYLVAPYGENSDLEMSVKLEDRKMWPWWRQFYQGLGQYRLGRFQNAADLLEKDISELGPVNRVDRPPCEADCFLVLAMARLQLNQTNEAQAALAHGREVAEKKIPQLGSPDLGPYWWNGVTTRALLKESLETVEAANTLPSKASLTFSLTEGAGAGANRSQEIIPLAGPFSEPPPGSLQILPQSVSLNGGQMRFTVAGITPGGAIVIEASHKLFTPDSWTPISTNIATGTNLNVDGISATNLENQFFRVIETIQ